MIDIYLQTTKKPKYTDNEGYPRADIDIWSIAEVRKKVVMLQNDHIAIMKQIEKLLMEAFKNTNNDNKDNTENDDDNKVMQSKEEEKKVVSEQEKNDIIKSMKQFISSANNNNDNNKDSNKEKEIDLNSLSPFYVIDQIFNNSPSHSAGLKTGDLIIKFGSMTHLNQSPQLMQQIVKQSINKEIPVIIKRNPEGFRTFQLIPQQWDGKGLLGCRLTPYQAK